MYWTVSVEDVGVILLRDTLLANSVLFLSSVDVFVPPLIIVVVELLVELMLLLFIVELLLYIGGLVLIIVLDVLSAVFTSSITLFFFS